MIYSVIVSLFYCLCCLLAIHNVFRTPMARYSLFVLKLPLNTN